MHRPVLALRAALLGLGLALAFGCGSAAPRKKEPLGVLPSATTTAQPEWLPPRVMAGRAAAGDPRERQLYDLRRLTEGWDVRGASWDRALYFVAAEPGQRAALYRLALEAGAAPERISRTEDEVKEVTAAAGRVIYRTDARLFELEAGGPRALPAPPSLSSIALASDGATLWAVVLKEGQRELVSVSAQGVSAPIFTGAAIAEVAPAASPDGSYLLLGQGAGACGRGPKEPPCDGRAQRVVRLSREGRGPSELAALAPPYAWTAASWHPGGRVVAIASDVDRAAGEIYLADADRPAEGLGRVTFAQASSPAFAPDGRALAFASTRGGATRDLYVASFTEAP